MKCPKCHFDNPNGTVYCGRCAAPLPFSEEVSVTETLETPVEGLRRGATFAERYEIIEELGTGGMGKVYRVKDEKLDEEMALKVLKPDIAVDKSMIERFKNELKLARKIAHRSVCKMYDLNEEEGTHFITMEYVPGEDLKSYIRKKGKTSEEETIFIAKQVCEGLSEAHELGVVHRDLKPQNIMIDERGRAKIMDFGIARSVEAPGVTQTGVMIGTPDYISPEQAEGEEADQRSDIYALGVILYEMVTGSVPFKGDTALSVALKHKTKLPPDPKKLNPEVSDSLSRLILICMEKDRERRYQTAEELLSDLRNIEDGLPLGTKIRPRRETIISILIRKKLFIPALVVALAIVTVAIWQLLPQQGAIPLAASGKPSLAVVYFENNTGDESLDHWRKALSELLITDLSQSKYLDVLPGDRLYKILSEMNHLETKSYSSDVLKEVATRGEVENIIRGNFTKAGDTIRINIMLQTAKTGELVGSERTEGIGAESMFTMVDELTRKVKANFNLTAEEIAGDIDRDIGQITTSSPEAYKYLMEGVKNNLEGNYRRAIQFMERAVAVDPEFATAYSWMGSQYKLLGYMSESRKNIQKAFELSDRIPDRERYRIQGRFYAESDKTYDKAAEALTTLLQLYPDDWPAIAILVRIYKDLEQWDKAIELGEKSLQNKVEAYYSYYTMAWAYQGKGMYDKAREVCEYYINNISDHWEMHHCLAINYLFQRKYELGLAEVDKVFSLVPEHPWDSQLKAIIYHLKGDLIRAEEEHYKLMKTEAKIFNVYAKEMSGALYLLQGKFEKSKEQLNEAIELEESLTEAALESRHHSYLAYVYTESGNHEKALEECNNAWISACEADQLILQILALHSRGLTYLGMKSIDEAFEISDELKELINKGFNKKAIRHYYHLLGMIELERNNFSKAIEYFNQALSLLPFQYPSDLDFGYGHALFIDSLASVYYLSGDVRNAREEYEKITALTTGRFFFGDIYAKSFYILGKIYEEQGNIAKAIGNYEKFLDLWKDADPGITEVEDARKRLTGLKSQ